MSKIIGFMKKFISNPDVIFVILFIIFASFYYDSVLTKGPLNAHYWRQTDCLSISHCYSEGVPFFKPEMHNQLGDKFTSGRTAGEFPIIYYVIGNLWKVFGESYFSYRIFCLLMLFAGLFAFFKSLRILFNDNFWAITLGLLLFTSPTLVFYGASFLTDAPAFSFILIALYFFVKYSFERLRKFFFLSMAFFALAGLVKVSSLIAFIFLGFIFLLECLSFKSLGKKKLFQCDRYEWLGFASAILVVFSWYYYAAWFNNIHGFKYTFNDIYPIWLNKNDEIITLVKDVKNFTSYVFFSRAMLIAFFTISIVNLTLWKKIPPLAYLSNIIIIIGSVIYFLLWAPLMGVHDYYYVALLILFPGILLPFIWHIKINHPAIFSSFRLKFLLGLFLAINFFYCLSVIKLKTSARKGYYPMVWNSDFVESMKYTNYEVDANWNRFVRMKPYIRQIGVKKDDLIISLPDGSFNKSLYLVGQKGWTDYTKLRTQNDIKNLINHGAKYLFISDTELLKADYLAPFLTEKAGSFEGVEIFRLSKNQGI